MGSSWEIPKNLNWDKIKDDAIGIDLGTTRCCCAVSRSKGVVETVALDNSGERLLPSFVGYDEENVKCGQIVIDRINNYSNSTVFDIKRIIGRKFSDIIVDPSWTFSLKSDNNNNPLIQTEYCGNLITLSPSQVSATLLKHVKTESEKFQGKKLKNVVVTIPAVFSGQQCNDTIQASNLAEFNSVTLLPEPVAAAFSYFFDREIPNNSNMPLFDLGGGTLDVCVFRIFNNKINIISKSGDSEIGGRNFDNVLFEYLKQKLKNDFNINNIDKKKYKLLSKCQEIKETLSVVNDYSFDVSDFETSINAFIKITREKFEQLSLNLMEKIKTTINMALNDKGEGIRPNEINSILLVGGGSRMPMIKNLLHNIFPDAEQRIKINPDEAVAKGAAYYACHLISNQVMKDQILAESNSEFRNENVFLKDIKNGPDEVASTLLGRGTMESSIVIFPHGLIEGETTLIGKHWLLGFKGH
uniref:Heat shock protein 70 n=1 Tax=Panagrolaimus davidi TaxID=227884 RepID=A0A914Q2A3_9BILA